MEIAEFGKMPQEAEVEEPCNEKSAKTSIDVSTKEDTSSEKELLVVEAYMPPEKIFVRLTPRLAFDLDCFLLPIAFLALIGLFVSWWMNLSRMRR